MTLPATKNPYPYADTIGAQVRDERNRQELSDNRLAKMAGVSRRHLVELQKGANVTLSVTEKVMEALELTAVQFKPSRRLTMSSVADDSATYRQRVAAASEQIQTGVALILSGATALRQSHQVVPATVKPELAAKAARLITDFGKYVRNLDSEQQIDALHLIFTESSLTGPAPAKKRRKKTA
jgi:predicted transcriptional regulator